VTFHNSSAAPASAISSSADAQPILINAGAVERQDNSNASNILPLTTLRTIDLRGRKNPGSLFSRFCEKMRVFFDVNTAPEYVQTDSETYSHLVVVAIVPVIVIQILGRA
jgi:hypothetical protein